MSNRLSRTLTATSLAVVGAAVLAGGPAPAAHAGGPGIHYIFGTTKSTCTKNLAAAVKLYRTNDYLVTGVHGCRLAGDRHRYFGDFVANPRS